MPSSRLEGQKAGFPAVGGSGPTGDTPLLTLQRGYEAAQIGVLRAAWCWRATIYGASSPVHWSPSSRTAPGRRPNFDYSDGHTSPSALRRRPSGAALPEGPWAQGAWPPLASAEQRIALAVPPLGPLLAVAIWTTNPGPCRQPGGVREPARSTKPSARAIGTDGAARWAAANLPAKLIVAAAIGGRSLQTSLGCRWNLLTRKRDSSSGLTYAPVLEHRSSGGGDRRRTTITATRSGHGLVPPPRHGRGMISTPAESTTCRCSGPVDAAHPHERKPGVRRLERAQRRNGANHRRPRRGRRLLKQESYAHRYPTTGRTKKPTIFPRHRGSGFALGGMGFGAEAMGRDRSVEWCRPAGRNRIEADGARRGDWCISAPTHAGACRSPCSITVKRGGAAQCRST